jgi:N-acetylglucosamine-6-sulfatase
LLIAPFQALRTKEYLYVEYINGDVELYGLRQDPHQLENLSATADPALIRRLSDRLSNLSRCAAEGCRQIENAPLPP